MSFRPFTFSDYIQLYMHPSIKTVTFTASELETLRQVISSAIFKAETSLEATKTLLTIETKLLADTCPSCGSLIPQKKGPFTVDYDPDIHSYIVKTRSGTIIKSFSCKEESNSSKASAVLEAHQLCAILNK